MLTWSQSARNPISEDLSFKNFPGEKGPRPSYSCLPSVVCISKPFSKILHLPQIEKMFLVCRQTEMFGLMEHFLKMVLIIPNVWSNF